MLRSHSIAVAATALLCLAPFGGCGTSDEKEVAEVLESYPHALATGDAKAACEAWSPQGQREQSGRSGDFCAYLRRTVSEMTSAERHRSAAAHAVRVEGRR